MYYFFGSIYFIYNDYFHAKKNISKTNFFEINQDELFDRLIDNE